MGMIYKRGKTYWIKYYNRGKPIRESTSSRKEADAKRLLKKREGEIAEGKMPGVYFDRIKFEELAEDFLQDYRINGKKSLPRAKRSVKHLAAVFEGYKATTITTPKIQGYIEQRIAVGAANATINRELSALKRMFNLGAKQTPPKVALVPFIPMLKENNTRKGFFEHGEFLALRKNLPDYLKGFVTFGYKTGWRLGEIAGLKWDHVDMLNGIVRLEANMVKNEQPRTVYLDDELNAIFHEQQAKRRVSGRICPYVFPNKDGTSQIKDFRSAWFTGCKKAKTGHRIFHDLRRTAVRNMVRSGIPERVAMMVSGHKTRSIFDRYNIVNDADLKLAAQRQESYLNNQSTGTVLGTIDDFQKHQGVKQKA